MIESIGFIFYAFMDMITEKFFYVALVLLFLYVFWKRKKRATTSLREFVKQFVGYFLLGNFVLVSFYVVGMPYLNDFLFRYVKYHDPFFLRIQSFSFCDGVSVNDFLNVLFFVPLGFLLPLFWKNYRLLWKTTLFCFSFSVFLECGQMVSSFRQFEYNDVVMNTLGGICGWGGHRLLKRYFKVGPIFSNKESGILDSMVVVGIYFWSYFFFASRP